jgi:hypothetical protein
MSTLTIKAAARLLGVSEATLRRWDHLRKVPARRHPINGYRLYDRDELLALRSRAQSASRCLGNTPSTAERPRLVDIPSDFPNFAGSRDVAVVDTLIVMLLGDRDLLVDATWRETALRRIERARSTIVPFGGAPYSRTVRLELLVTALDRGTELEAPVEAKVSFVRMLIEEAMPSARPKDELVRDAVCLWREKRRTEERTRAVRAMARALQCDSPSLMTMLRAARKRLREGMSSARRK